MTETGETDVVRGAAGMPEAPVSADVAAVDDVEEAMRDVVDPELGINVVDLGLVYDIKVETDNTATIDMTLTSAACPLTDVIEDQTRAALTSGPGPGDPAGPVRPWHRAPDRRPVSAGGTGCPSATPTPPAGPPR